MLSVADEQIILQCGIVQYASSNPCRVRIDRGDLYRYYMFDSVWMSSSTQELANIPRPWKYVGFPSCSLLDH